MKEVLDLQLQLFLRDVLPERDSILNELEDFAKEHHVSIIEPEVAQLIRVLLKLTRPKTVLEIGTAIGYSAICIARELPSDGHLTTVEIIEKRVEEATENIAKANLSDKITIIQGDAKEVVPSLTETYDLIFMDAAKGQYSEFLKIADRILKPGGLIIADNVLINGWVIDFSYPERRKKTMVCKMRTFLDNLKHEEGYESTIVPLGDGVALIWKKEN